MLLHALLTFRPPSSPPCIFFHLLITRNLLLLSFAIAFRLCCQPALHRDVLSSWGFVYHLPGKSPQTRSELPHVRQGSISHAAADLLIHQSTDQTLCARSSRSWQAHAQVPHASVHKPCT